MDDEIEIEEHDILEHPQVKAIFPDLEKIRIQVHAAEEPFLDDTSVHEETSVNLLEERKNYADYNFEDDINDDLSSQDLKEGNFEEAVLDEDFFTETADNEVNDFSEAEDVLVVSDSEFIKNATLAVEEPNYDKDNIGLEKVDLIVSDEFVDETQFNTSSKLTHKVEEETTDISTEDRNLECKITVPVVEDVHEISDDEAPSQELVENDDELILGKPDIRDECIEAPGNDDEVVADDESDKLLASQNDEEFEEAPSNDGLSTQNELINANGNIDDEFPEKDNEVDQKCSEDTDVGYQPISVKEEIEYEPESLSDFDETFPEESFNHDELPPEDIYHFNNKIILGSKPNAQVQSNIKKSHLSSYLVVELDDWDVHLSRSQSYCDDCMTLFTTPNALYSHRMTVHSLLAPITNRAVKSTAKSSINVARKSTTNIKSVAKMSGGKDMSNSTYCNHCNVTFKDHTTLIKHLYMLLPAKQHQCNICDATFQSQVELANHSSIHVKLEQPRKVLKAKKSDNSILRKMLNNEIKPMTSRPLKRCHEKPTLNKKQSDEAKKMDMAKWWSSRFKCLVCNDVLESYTKARSHRRMHPEVLALAVMFKRLPPKPLNSKDNLTYDLIPKSALFQCSKCSLNFSSCVAASSHFTGNRCGDKVGWACPICKKKFRKTDKLCHTKQHELGTKLKIYKFTKTTYGRTLCKCLKCCVHFEYIPLKKHITKCGKIPSSKCQKCNILIPKHKLAEHNKRHDIMKLKPRDFIIVEYAVVNAQSQAKPAAASTSTKSNKLKTENTKDLAFLLGKKIKTEPDSVKQPKILSKLKFEQEKIRLYYCKHCKGFLSRRAKAHFTKQCVGRYKFTSNCKFCGLQIFLKYRDRHLNLHSRYNFTLKDIEFLDIQTLKPITPPIPDYPSCSKCQIHFLERTMLSEHICGEDYDNCEVCGLKFENSALSLHLRFHQLATAKRKPPNPQHKLTELMMKYESLNAIWNILFICGKCDLVTDMYNKAVEHSQAHLKKDNTQHNNIKCYICNLKFDETCWSKHSELHSRMTINNKDFKLLNYNPSNLLEESWFQMFENLPEQEIRQIIDRSVFGSERSLKMKLVKDGLPEFTLYCCSKCKVSYDNNDIPQHVKDPCRVSKHVCTDCDVAFDTAKTLQFHILLHEKGIKTEEFRIVNFVKDSTVTNKKAEKTAKATVKSKKDLKVEKKSEKGKKYTLYKCLVCSVCVLIKHNMGTHICAPEHHLIYCKICKQNFSFRQMGCHRPKHKNQPDFRAKNMRIVDFKPTEGNNKNSSMVKSSKTSKKQQSASLASLSSQEDQSSLTESETHSKRKRPSNSCESLSTSNPAKSKASKSLNSSKRSVESDDDDEKTAKLYKCDCGLHYTSLKTIEKHIESCDNHNQISKESCSKCGLLFATDILVSHLCKHHSQNTKLIVEEVHKKSSSEATSTQDRHKGQAGHMKLYKCGDCNVYFLNQNSCYKHTSKHEPLDPKQYIECKMCCLQFKILSLHIHMKKHHESEFNLEMVLVEEYHPSVGKEAPKIDIYFASERFQNVQVSSSND